MSKTVIVNKDKCKYTDFICVGKEVIAYSWKGGIKKLDIKRVIVVNNKTQKKHNLLSFCGLVNAELVFDVDLDMYLQDGSVIEIHTTDPKFLNKLVPYIWELNRNTREEFYRTAKNGRK